MPGDYTDARRYEWARAGGDYLGREDIHSAGKSLDRLVDALGLGEDAGALLRGTQASERGVATALSVYAEKDSERRGNLRISELPDFYGEAFGEYVSEGDADAVRELFTAYDEETYGDLMKSFSRAQTIVKNPAGFSDEEIEEAKIAIQKYKPVRIAVDVFERYELRKMTVEDIDVEVDKEKIHSLVAAEDAA